MSGLGRMIMLALFLAGSMSGCPHAFAQSAFSAASPTLKETTEWLSPHLMGVVHTSRQTVVTYRTLKKGKEPKEVDREAINTRVSVSAATFDGCSLTLGQLTEGDDYRIITLSTVPLDHLKLASFKVEPQAPAKLPVDSDPTDSIQTTILPTSAVVITLESSTNVITWTRKTSGNAPVEVDPLPYEGRSSTLQIYSDDEAMPPRLVKALNHAIDLCRVNEKPEPF